MLFLLIYIQAFIGTSKLENWSYQVSERQSLSGPYGRSESAQNRFDKATQWIWEGQDQILQGQNEAARMARSEGCLYQTSCPETF